jgi:predicted phosphate transport protein (TIGR00153 family)
MSKRSIFGRSKAIERKIDEFLDKVSESALVFVAMLHHTLDGSGNKLDETGRRRGEQMLELKKECSRLRREVESELYTERLIPDLLGDVAGLIESLHDLVESMHHAMIFSRYARLEPPEFVRDDGKEMATAVGHSVEQLVHATRAFFRDFTHVRDFVHKVGFYESESDTVRDRLLNKIYATDLGLAEQNHMASAVREIDGVADRAERIADTLTIYAIKRSE